MSINPLNAIKVSKHIAPAIFENKTPRVHLELLEFIFGKGKYKAIVMFRGGGKTTNANKIGMFSYIFLKHERYIQIFSATQDKGIKFLSDVKTMITNAMKKGYDIQKGSIWRDDAIEVTVDSSTDNPKTVYVEVFGAGQDPRGGSYDFARPSLQIYDDIESKEGKYAIASRLNRQKLEDWFTGTCLPSLGPTGRVIFIGTILHDDSLLNKIITNKGDAYPEWNTKLIPIIRNGKSAWPDRFPLTSTAARKKEKEIFEKTGTEVEIEAIEDIKRSWAKKGLIKLFYQEYLCVAQPEEAKLFKPTYYKYFNGLEYDADDFEYLEFNNAIDEAKELIMFPKSIILEDGTKIPITETIRYATKDQGSTKLKGSKSKRANDDSVVITCAYDTNNNMYILDIKCGKWTPFDKSLNILKSYKEFEYQRLGIESGGMQNDFFYTIDEAQKATDINVPVEPVSHGGVDKNIRISHLQPLFLAGKIFFNKKDPNTDKLIAELNAFDIEVEGIDNLMDTLAYQLHFVAGRTFEMDNYEEEEESTW